MRAIGAIFLAAALLGAVIFVHPSGSQAAIVNDTTPWQVAPGSASFYTFSFDFSGFDDDFLMTNLNGDSITLIGEGQTVSGNTVYIWQEDGAYYANLVAMLQEGAISLTDGIFGFSFGGSTQYDLSLNSPDNYLLLNVPPSSMWVNVTGAAPVPIPASVLLLGTGLIGIVGFRRRVKKVQSA